MAAQRQVPGGAYVNETATQQRQAPGFQYVNETIAAAASAVFIPIVGRGPGMALAGSGGLAG